MKRNYIFAGSRIALLAFLLLPAGAWTAGATPKVQVVPKWSRFEEAFKSSLTYSNALQDASLTVQFTSPLGETFKVDGFWDGGRTWRVRFSPDQAGHWKFQTACSDTANEGLHGQTGEFICSAALGQNLFHKHGPVRVAPDRRHLAQADGTPFFWLADTTWNGALVSEPKDWEFYTITRLHQRFTVVQWAAAPGQDAASQSAWTGFPEHIGVNPAFFRRLDAKLEKLSQAGILSAITPLLELAPRMRAAPPLPDEQAELLVRYMVARWGAEPVAWVLAFDGDAGSKKLGRWKRIGQAVFGSGPHAPVVLYPGDTEWVLDEFRDQPWVDVFGYQSVTDCTEDALKWTVSGPFVSEWKKEPARPVIPFLPCENGVTPHTGKRFSSDDVRRAAYWSSLLSPPAGVSYCAQGVMDWDITVGPSASPKDLPLWHKALFMPAAKQMSFLASLMLSSDFAHLRPQPKLVAAQPGQDSPRRFIAAAAADPSSICLVYVPEERTLELVLKALPASPAVSWLNPRTGANNPAVAVVSESSCQFPTPEPGDWVLQIKAGK
jgi:hypothetical protein